MHSENAFASGQKKRPRGPRSKLIKVSPQLDLESRALNFYFANYLRAVEDVPIMVRDLSECVSIWKVSGASCPMVDLAVSIIALTAFAQIPEFSNAAVEASQLYGRLLESFRLKLTHMIIPNSDAELNDACLLTASLMARYEDMSLYQAVGQRQQVRNRKSFVHQKGVISMLNTWKASSNQRHPTFIVKQTRRGLLRYYLLKKLPVQEWMMDGQHFGEEGLELQYDHILVAIANLQYVVAAHTSKCIFEAEALFERARELDQGLDAWNTQIPKECLHQQSLLPPANIGDSLPNNDFYSSVIYSYPKPEFAASWIQYFALRMLVNSIQLTIVESTCSQVHPDENFGRPVRSILKDLQVNADLMMSSIPFCLGKVKRVSSSDDQQQIGSENRKTLDVMPYLASMLVWPIMTAISITQLDVARRHWLIVQLAKLRKITGVKCFIN